MSKRNLLIVHGSGLIRNRLKSFILSELDDVAVFDACSSKDTVQKCQEQRYEILVCSKELPDASGLAFYQNIQAMPGQKDISVIFITSTGYDTNYEDIEANVINMSLSGIACDFGYNDEHVNILGGTTISVKFPSEHNNFQVKNLPCKFLRLNVLTWRPDDYPDKVRAAWAILGIEGQEKKQLEKVFEKVKKGLD